MSAIAALALALAPVPAQAAPTEVTTAPGSDVATHYVDQSPGDVDEYWTDERLEQAIPADTRDQTGGSEGVPAKVSTTVGDVIDLVLAPEATDVLAYPKRAHGKVFFSIGSSNYVCSGTSVESAESNLVLTAGHCAYDIDTRPNQFVQNFLFVPAYHDGERPYGSFAAESLHVTEAWRQGWMREDFALAVVKPTAAGEVGEVVGTRGIAFNQPRDQQYTLLGYPAESPYTGRRMIHCDAAYMGDDGAMGDGQPAPMQVPCNLTGGSSGGGWVGPAGLVQSVVSYGYLNDPDTIYGPYFGESAKALYESANGSEAAAPDRVAPGSLSAGDGRGGPLPGAADVAPDPGAPADSDPGPQPAAPVDSGSVAGEESREAASKGRPKTWIMRDPGRKTRKKRPRFSFRSNQSAATFECKLDRGNWKRCAKKKRLRKLSKGRHTLRVRAKSDTGLRDQTPAKHRFKVRKRSR